MTAPCSSWCATRASAFRRPSPAGSSSPSSPPTATRAGSGCQSAARSSKPTGDGSGSRRTAHAARPSTSRCPPRGGHEMPPPEPTVFVVDDDRAMRDSLSWLLDSVGLRVRSYANAADFLAEHDPAQPVCLVLDVRMPGLSGLDLH